jgi:hypothetical protein
VPKPTKLHRIPPAILQRSREFRYPLTPTEAKVWQGLGGTPVAGANRVQQTTLKTNPPRLPVIGSFARNAPGLLGQLSFDTLENYALICPPLRISD